MSGWRPALRIARRSIRRNLGRSLLVAVLVGLPVAAATMVDVVARTLYSPERDAAVAMGAADAQATVTGGSRLETSGRRPGAPTPRAPASPTAIPRPSTSRRCCRRARASRRTPRRYLVGLQAGERGVRAQLVVADPREPLHRHEAKLEDGRAPTRPDEVLISPSLAERIDAGVGSTIHPADGPPLTVTGIAEATFCLSCEQVVALPGSRAARLVADEAPINLSTDGPTTSSTCRRAPPPRRCGPRSPSTASRSRRARRTCTPSATTAARPGPSCRTCATSRWRC